MPKPDVCSADIGLLLFVAFVMPSRYHSLLGGFFAPFAPYLFAACYMLAAPLGAIAQEPSHPLRPSPQLFTIQHYDADIDLTQVSQRRIRGRVNMAVSFALGHSDAVVRFHAKGFDIDSVAWRGVRVEYSTTNNDAATADFAAHVGDVSPSLVPDTLTVWYSGTMTHEGGTFPWGGVHLEGGILYALGVGFTAPYVSTTRHWLPCYDHPSMKATFRARFTIAVGNDVASNGLRTFDTIIGNRRIVEWSMTEPSATYLLTFALGPYAKIVLPWTTPIEIYALRNTDTLAAKRSFSLVPRMADVLTEFFGPYPFSKIGYCATTRGAMEHQTMVSYPVSLMRSNDTVNTVAAHELAHQWFGDLVTPVDFRHAWLTESFATFSECLWLEKLSDTTRYFFSVKSKADEYINTIAKSEGVFGLVDYPRTGGSSNYPQTIYQKGAVVLAMARTIAGDEAFFAALQSYLNEHRLGTATTDDFIEHLTSALGERTQNFVQQWITGKGWPILTVDRERLGTFYRYTIRQTQQTLHPDWPIFTELPLNVRYVAPNTGDTSDVILFPNDTGSIVLHAVELLDINAGRQSRCLVGTDPTTSVNDSEHQSASLPVSLHIRPNPAQQKVHFVVKGADGATNQTMIVDVYDLSGRAVASLNIDSDVMVDVSTWPAGTYTARLHRDARIITSSFVVVK